MITSFRNDDADRDRGNKNTNKIPKAIESIHLADCGDNCSKPDDDSSVASFESTTNDRGTTDDNNLPRAEAPVVDSEFGNDNINENVVTGDDDNATMMIMTKSQSCQVTTMMRILEEKTQCPTTIILIL